MDKNGQTHTDASTAVNPDVRGSAQSGNEAAAAAAQSASGSSSRAPAQNFHPEDIAFAADATRIPRSVSNQPTVHVPGYGDVIIINSSSNGSAHDGVTPKHFWEAADGSRGMIKYAKGSGVEDILGEQVAIRLTEIVLGKRVGVANCQVRFAADQATGKVVPVIFSIFNRNFTDLSSHLVGNHTLYNEGIIAEQGENLQNVAEHDLGLLLHLTALFQDTDTIGKDGQNKGFSDSKPFVFDTVFQTSDSPTLQAITGLGASARRMGWWLLDERTLAVKPLLDGKRRSLFSMGADIARHKSVRNLSALADDNLENKLRGLFKIFSAEERMLRQIDAYHTQLSEIQSRSAEEAEYLERSIRYMRSVRETLFLRINQLKQQHIEVIQLFNKLPIALRMPVLTSLYTLRMLYAGSRTTFSHAGVALAHPSIAETPEALLFPLSARGVACIGDSISFAADVPMPDEILKKMSNHGIRFRMDDHNKMLIIEANQLQKLNDRLVLKIHHPEMLPLDKDVTHYYQPLRGVSFLEVYHRLDAANRNVLMSHKLGQQDPATHVAVKAQVIKQLQLALYNDCGTDEVLAADLKAVTGLAIQSHDREPLLMLLRKAHALDLNDAITNLILKQLLNPAERNLAATTRIIQQVLATPLAPREHRVAHTKEIREAIMQLNADFSRQHYNGLSGMKQQLLSLISSRAKHTLHKHTSRQLVILFNTIDKLDVTPTQLQLWISLTESIDGPIFNLAYNKLRALVAKNYPEATPATLPVSRDVLMLNCSGIVQALWLMEHRHDGLNLLLAAQQAGKEQPLIKPVEAEQDIALASAGAAAVAADADDVVFDEDDLLGEDPLLTAGHARAENQPEQLSSAAGVNPPRQAASS